MPSSRTATIAAPDVQAQPPDAAGQPLARRRDRRREGHPHQPGRRRAALLRAARVLRRPRPAAEGRAHVALRGGRQRGDRRGRSSARRPSRPRRSPQHIAERVRDRQGARRAEVTIAARYPEHKPAPVSRHPDAGDLHALRLGGRLRARHAPADRRRRAGHDRLPVRAGARRRQRARAARGRRLRPTTRSSGSSSTSPSRRTTSAASARCTSAAPSSARTRSTRARCWRSSRARCRRRSTS